MDHFTAKEDQINTRHLSNPVILTEAISIGYKQYGRKRNIISTQLNLCLNSGQLTCLIGPNGVGKSTLIRSLSGLMPILDGNIKINGRNINQYKPDELARNVSVVLTEQVNVGAMKSFDVVSLGRYPYTTWLGRLTKNDHQIIISSLEAVEALNLIDKPFHELSDGERQKILIARALAQESSILILDEPTAFLDLPRKAILINLLKQLAHDHNKAVLVSTHDLDLVLQNADLIWLMDKDGNIQQGGPEDLVISGQFDSTFERHGAIGFDNQTGGFTTSSLIRGRVSLSGEGLPYHWTLRALKRSGFQILPEGSNTLHRIRIIKEDMHLHWQLFTSEIMLEFDSIYALLIALNEENNTKEKLYAN